MIATPRPSSAPIGRPPAAELLALDIGGANLKAADGLGWAHAEVFPLWRNPDGLAAALARLIRRLRPRQVVATMTGEIADCFRSRAEGVAHIVAAVVTAARQVPGGVGIYVLEPAAGRITGRIVSPAEAVARPLTAAAANWHALARLAAVVAPTDRSVMLDVGSTTTDIVAIAGGVPVSTACDDAGRLHAGELVYTGMERTPVAAVVRSLPHRGVRRPIATERFADSRDAWILLGGLPERSGSTDTADGGPADREGARVRLARMLLVEPAEFSAADAHAAAAWVAEAQVRQVATAARRVAAGQGWRPTSMVVSGHGGPLATRVIARMGWNAEVVSLADRLGPEVSRVGPAHAVALVARGLLP
jgi:probable H4MPT-linked C1 transfer pathway protein